MRKFSFGFIFIFFITATIHADDAITLKSDIITHDLKLQKRSPSFEEFKNELSFYERDWLAGQESIRIGIVTPSPPFHYFR